MVPLLVFFKFLGWHFGQRLVDYVDHTRGCGCTIHIHSMLWKFGQFVYLRFTNLQAHLPKSYKISKLQAILKNKWKKLTFILLFDTLMLELWIQPGPLFDLSLGTACLWSFTNWVYLKFRWILSLYKIYCIIRMVMLPSVFNEAWVGKI